MSNKFSVEYIKKNFKVKNFCKHLEHLEHLLKKKSDGTNKDILSQPPIYLFVLYSALVNNVEKFNEPIKLTKNSTGKDLESFKAGEKYKVIFSYKEIDKEFIDKKNNDLYQFFLNYSSDGTLLERLSDNFKLIYHFPIGSRQSLIFSKLNKKYYHMEFLMETDAVNGFYYNLIVNTFNKKITLTEFFNSIVNHFAENDLIDPKSKIDEHEMFADNDDITKNYYFMEKDAPGSLKLFKKDLVKEQVD